MSINDTLKEALEKLNRFLTKQADTATLTSGKLSDGTEIKYPGELAVGTSVIVVTPEGEIPAPDGEHTLEDGTIIKTEGGNITEIMAVQTKPEEMPKEEVKQAEVADEKIMALEAKIDAIGQMLTNLLAGLEMDMAAKEKVMQSLQSDVDKLKAKPATAPLIKPIIGEEDPLKKEVERIQSLQNKTRK